ncbi:RHS repeat-associated core domain-containing protein [Kitasatospora sp. NPDC057904]|uniref:RHS repeat-associated core domain-containing protein n=1 Tax=Kitasatospora sp. NPDC057904 TaxID=3346275 RepID=UPI0036DCB217
METSHTNSQTSTGTRYYAIPGGITLVRQGPTKLTHRFSDTHGSNTLSIDSATTSGTRRSFDPFGAARGAGSLSTPWSGNKGFVNGLKDDTTGFTNLGARQYQPTTGRFLSPDPILDAKDPLQRNAYAYSNNNPVNRSGPNSLIVVRRWYHRILHNRLAARLWRALRPLPKVVVTTVPFHV